MKTIKVEDPLEKVEVGTHLLLRLRGPEFRGRTGAWIEITSTTKVDGRYPGVWGYFENDEDEEWVEGGEAWIVDANGVDLVVDNYYRATPSSVGGDPAKPIFYTDRDAGSGITSLNGLTAATQTFAVGTSGTDVNWSSSVDEHTLNVPDASASARGAVTTGDQEFGGNKSTNGKFIALGSAAIRSQYASDVYTELVHATYSGQILVRHDGFADPYFQVHMILNGPGTDDDGLVIYSGTNAVRYGIKVADLSYRWGAWGTSGGGDTVCGGIITSLGSGGGVSIGDPIGSGTSNSILFVDASNNLAESADFTFDDAAKTLTLGSAGYLVSSRATTPTLSANSTLAGPYLKDF